MRTEGGEEVDRHEEGGGGAGQGVGRTEWSGRPEWAGWEHRKALRERGPAFSFTDQRTVSGIHPGTDEEGTYGHLYPVFSVPSPAQTKQNKPPSKWRGR